MEEIAVRRAAFQMMQLHGPEAASAAIVKADEMLNRGNIEGYYAWNRIRAAIRDADLRAACQTSVPLGR